MIDGIYWRIPSVLLDKSQRGLTGSLRAGNVLMYRYMRTNSHQPLRIAVQENDGSVHAEFQPRQFTLAELPELYQLPHSVRDAVLEIIFNPRPQCTIVRNGGGQSFIARVQAVSQGSVSYEREEKRDSGDQPIRALGASGLMQTYHDRQPSGKNGWGTY